MFQYVEHPHRKQENLITIKTSRLHLSDVFCYVLYSLAGL